MPFEDLEKIFSKITEQPHWSDYRQYCHLVEIWQAVVKDTPIASETKVLYLSRRILWVATSSAAWAQNLTMQRYSLRQRLNALLVEPIADLRFSSAAWARLTPKDLATDFSSHPSYLGSQPSREAGFAAWVAQVRSWQESLPSCPQCGAPTPLGELERWGVCRFCAVEQFDKYP